MMTDCVGISKIAMGLCSGVLGICRSQVVASFVARIQYCSRGIEILFLAPVYRITRAGMQEPVDWCLWSMEM